MFGSVVVVAHQGGWDEALMVAGPLAVIAGLLWLAKRRADRLAPPTAPGADRVTRVAEDTHPEPSPR